MEGNGVRDANACSRMVGFEDFLPVMAHKLGGQGLLKELCNGFQLLVDKEKGVITVDSLRKNAGLMGLTNLSDEELECMVTEGDFDGDGALNQTEFCVLMFRLSPGLMNESKLWLQGVLKEEEDDPYAFRTSKL